MAQVANSLNNFLEKRDQATKEPGLKYQTMWANFDRMVSKLDEDTVEDLNVDIKNLIGAALKKKRDMQKP